VTKAPDLSKFSVAEKDALILAPFELLATAHQRIEEQDKTIAEQAERIAALEAKLERVITGRQRRQTTRRCRHPRVRRKIEPSRTTTARDARAGRVPDGHCILTPTAWLMRR
jgi:hypothetical protein